MTDPTMPAAHLIAFELEQAGITLAPDVAPALAVALVKAAAAVQRQHQTMIAEGLRTLAANRADPVHKEIIELLAKAVATFPVGEVPGG